MTSMTKGRIPDRRHSYMKCKYQSDLGLKRRWCFHPSLLVCLLAYMVLNVAQKILHMKWALCHDMYILIMKPSKALMHFVHEMTNFISWKKHTWLFVISWMKYKWHFVILWAKCIKVFLGFVFVPLNSLHTQNLLCSTPY